MSEKRDAVSALTPAPALPSPSAITSPVVDPPLDPTERPAILNQPVVEATRTKRRPEMTHPLASPVETPFPVESGNQTRGILDLAADVDAEEPSKVVQHYYDSINRRDLTGAYECLSEGFKARSPKEKFAQIFAATKSIKVRRLQETSHHEASSVVMISFVETDAENRTRQWERRVSLVKEAGAWRIDGTQSVSPAGQ